VGGRRLIKNIQNNEAQDKRLAHGAEELFLLPENMILDNIHDWTVLKQPFPKPTMVLAVFYHVSV
jgi:hypothetical protein